MKPSCALADLGRETPLSIATMEESNRSPKKGLEEGQSGLRVYLSIRGRTDPKDAGETCEPAQNSWKVFCSQERPLVYDRW